MKKTLQNLLARSGINDRGKFFSVKGGYNMMSVAQNASCTNSGETCNGSNSGQCTNGPYTYCGDATNTDICSNSRCFPL